MEASLGVEYFEESAVMVDTFAPLELGEGGLAAEDPECARSWAGGRNQPEQDGGPAVYSNNWCRRWNSMPSVGA